MEQKQYLRQAEKLYDLIEKAHDKKIHFWFEHVIFTWQWWLGVFLTVVPWILWFFLRKKESTFRLLCSGLLVMCISSWFDFVGIALGLWHYNYDVLPFLPSYLPWDFSLIPVIIMFLIQMKPHYNPYLKALLFAGGTAFIGEPFFVYIKTYSPEDWKYIYSFPILMGIYFLGHFISFRRSFEKISNTSTN
jgi:xanthine/uracil permease